MTVSRSRTADSAKPKRKHYDKDLIREKTFDLLAISLSGAGRDQGARLVWDCPACGKRDKYSVRKDERRGGCMVEGCRLAGYDDIFGMLARIHDLDYYFDFRSVLVNAYDLLGLQPSEKKANSASVRGKVASKTDSTKTADVGKNGSGSPETPESLVTDEELASRIYGRIMELCPLETRDRSYLRSRGLSLNTIRGGLFGTMTPSRARKVKATLLGEFDRDLLLRVPGFSEDERDGHLKFTLSGNYLLIPYHDQNGRISTIEGRSVGESNEGLGKYVSLRNAGNHLYVYPGHSSGKLQAVCEGAMGAIVAAEYGFNVGAVQGCQRFRTRVTKAKSGEPYAPLPELRGVDFGGRVVPYIPDADDPPNPNVLRAAPKAARWISEPQNGKPAICLLPNGTDLDEWLLSTKPEKRRSRFIELLASASPPKDGVWVETYSATGGEGKSERSSKAESQPRSTISRGTRRLRDEVYRKLLEILPLNDAHVEAFSGLGVWSATLRAGRFVSLNEDLAKKAASELIRSFGVKKLCVVPGFEADGNGTVRIPLAESCEYLLSPCFDSGGMISGLQVIPYDTGTGKILPDESVPFAESEEQLYVFAPYDLERIVGVCDGLLGALLAAQEDMAVGAIGFGRRRESCVDPGERRSQLILQQLEGVDFEGREVVYLLQARDDSEDVKLREQDIRIVERLIAKLNGHAVVREFPSGGTRNSDRPASLGEWMLADSEYTAGKRLRDLLGIECDEPPVVIGEDQCYQDSPDRISPGVAYSILLASSILASLLDAAILRVQMFAGFVSVVAGGKQLLYAGRTGLVRGILDSPPMWFLYESREPASLLFGIALTTGLLVHHRRGKTVHKESAARNRRHPSVHPLVAASDVLLTAVVWLAVVVILKLAMSLTEYLLRIFSLQSTDFYVEIPGADASLFVLALATCTAGFVLWRRMYLRSAQVRMLRGEIRH